MNIYKFGGASIKDDDGFNRVSDIIAKNYDPDSLLIIVISAVGKTTNNLEEVVRLVFAGNDYSEKMESIIKFHKDLCAKLELDEETISKLDIIFHNTIMWIENNEVNEFNFIYDHIISRGEMLSSVILSQLLKKKGLSNNLKKSTELIRTDNNYTDANINWETTEYLLKSNINTDRGLYIMQGFIGSDDQGNTTTLGREGSDYTAAIVAKCLKIKNVTIWKDVDGIYTADPNKDKNAKFIPNISYREAIEMTYYGAQVIHPKTIKPIQNSNSNLIVKSFINLDHQGTVIDSKGGASYDPIKVHKEDQVLFTFSERNLSFVNEKNIAKILSVFGTYSLRINCMQTTAINFMVLTDNKSEKLESVKRILDSEFDVNVNYNLNLLTIRHYTEDLLDEYRQKDDILIVQQSKNTIQYIF